MMAQSSANPKTKTRAPEKKKRGEPVIQVKGLVNAFGNNVIHDRADLDVMRGEVLGVVGGSGSGKSVLLRTIIGLNKPKEGEITVFGKPTSFAESTRMRALEMRWGVLFQEGALFSSQTVAENIMVPLREYTGMSEPLMEEIAAMKLTMVSLPEDTALKYPAQLSGGMKKRAGLARALALDPELLFLDEPTSGLDPISANQFDELIKDLSKSLRQDDDPWIQDYFGGVRGRAALVDSQAGAEAS
jgi:phospholipid/cholesterol/gamma-HCH transport system ATP-binding protein